MGKKWVLISTWKHCAGTDHFLEWPLCALSSLLYSIDAHYGNMIVLVCKIILWSIFCALLILHYSLTILWWYETGAERETDLLWLSYTVGVSWNHSIYLLLCSDLLTDALKKTECDQVSWWLSMQKILYIMSQWMCAIWFHSGIIIPVFTFNTVVMASIH